jgi:predicted nucleic acid-binding protein
MARLESILKNTDRVAIDTNSLIYLLEKNEKYFEICKEVFYSIEKGINYGITSVLILTEVLTKPYKDNNDKLIALYKTFINTFPNLTIKEINHEIAIKAAKLRAKYSLRTPDSIFIATAIKEKAQLFITNDIRLKKVEELDFLILDDYINN